MPTLTDLLNPRDEAGTLSDLLADLASRGFPTTAWQTGGVAYTLLRVEARALAALAKLVAQLAAGGLLDLATGGWLTLLAKSAYDLDRYAATYAEGSIRLAIAPGYGPQTIQPGQIWVTDNAGHRYNIRNAAPSSLSGGFAITYPFRAESPGAAYNVALGTGLSLVTPLPGMTATFVDAGGGTWLTAQGADEETDANLRIRCRARWATIGLQKTGEAYLYLALNAPGLTTQPNRVNVDDSNPRGPGTVDIRLAGPAGGMSVGDVSLVQTYIADRASPASDVLVQSANPTTVTIAATISYTAQYAQALAQAQAAVTDLINATPIGGTLRLAAVVEALMSPAGVYDATSVTINGVPASLVLTPDAVAVPYTFTLTPVATP